ncbi:hypothetical protein [Ktedonobacter racemifer]|uniref:hypothetical protein n=1 Tax=Ktedonobacter racemifer TaxID=363277 RepID=UPI0012F80291|nr:hypothetical protein [Ktedonobacter racemifer]
MSRTRKSTRPWCAARPPGAWCLVQLLVFLSALALLSALRCSPLSAALRRRAARRLVLS